MRGATGCGFNAPKPKLFMRAYKMTITEISTVKLPRWIIPFLEYGETDDMTPDEEKTARLFLKSFPDYEGLCFDYQGEYYFSHNNDVDGLGGDVIDAVVYGHYKMVDDETRSYGPQGASHA